MIFFRVTQNINIRTTDGTMVYYNKLKTPSDLENETIYISTYDDFKDIQEIFARVDKTKYFAKTLNETNIRALANFPVELGIPNINEVKLRDEINSVEFFEMNQVDIYKQLKSIQKDEITLAIIGGVGITISEIISSCTALRILHKKLKEIYTAVKFDIYINASNNSYYSRDKEIYKTQDYINNIYPLSITVKKLCEYDFFIDNSMKIIKLLEELNIIDAWLFKFGIDYKKVKDYEKYNTLDLTKYKVQDNLIIKLEEAKNKGKLLLFHPYSASVNKSIPQAVAIEMLKELLFKIEDYIIISTLQIDSKIKEDNYIDLSKESKSISDFIYIISNVDKIITADTSTYHISEVFMIPTVVFFTEKDYEKKIKYYNYIKPIFIKNMSKNLSKFIYENENLTIYKIEAWKKLKISRIIKLLDIF